jgi:hypothetical protein
MAITVKHKFVSTIPDSDDTSVVRPSNWNDDHDLTGTIPVANGGTGASTASDGLNNLLPSQTGNNGKVLSTDGTNATWSTNGSGDVVGPASSTNNAIARFDSTTGKLIKNSGVTVDNNNNIAANALDDAYTNTAASGTLITLTVASPRRYTITGSGGQVIKLPDATTLTNGTVFQFDNNQSSGAITVNNNSNTLIVSVPSGGFVLVNLLSNAIAAGSWDRHDQAPANVSWSTNTFDYAGSITSATWNGNTVAVNRGGTGVTTSTGSGSNVLNTSPTLTTPAITGGTIDNAVIGGTTPAAGTFTTITGQTEVLRGTGSNLLPQSQAFDNATNWGNTNTTESANSTTAPDGTTTADTVIASAGAGIHDILPTGITVVSGASYVASIFVKKDTHNFFQICVAAQATDFANFNVNTGVVGTTGGTVTATITSFGNGWYRCTLAYTASGTGVYPIFALVSSASATRRESWTATGTEAVFLWGAQLEIGTTANTYIPTTTTAIYGTPTLSFSGVAGLGLQSDGSLYVSPAGTGALQAQATTSSTVGGNARGANAVDWQTSRSTATMVASATGSVVGGGTNNLANASYSAVVGGYNDFATGAQSFVGSGENNTASGTSASVVGGHLNTAAGRLNFIGGGETNSGTASAAVTTQATTTVTSGSTAVTLSGSNAAIKVGQLITGTGIVSSGASTNYTYVAAISGTSLTLSQNASASGSPTLSFFTPHGVVVGGGNNQATGSYSFIGGGGDAGTAANRNVASGDWGTVSGGLKNTASGLYSVVAGGTNNTASGVASFVGGGGAFGNYNYSGNTASGLSSFVGAGFSNTSSSNASFIGGGSSNTSNGIYSAVIAGQAGTTRSIWGNHVIPAINPFGSTAGASQSAILVIGKQTTDATATVLTGDGGAASTTNQVILPNNSAYYFKGTVVAGVTGAGNTKGWTIEGVIKRGAGVGTTTLVGVTVMSSYADVGAATWTIGVTADTTNGGLAVTATGQASTTIRWVCKVETTEMTY